MFLFCRLPLLQVYISTLAWQALWAVNFASIYRHRKFQSYSSSHRTRNIQSWFKENSNPITHTNNSCPDSRKIPILVLIQYTCNIMSWFKENSNPITKQIIPVLIQKNSCPLKIILFWFKENSPFTNNPVLIQEEFQPYYILSCSNSSRILILLHIILSWFKQNSNPITFYPVLIQ